MANFNEILAEILTGARALALSTVSIYVDEAVADTREFLDQVEERLSRWARLLGAGELTTEEFEYLVRSQSALAEMLALKQSGLALVRVDEFKASLLNLITDTVFRFVLV